MQNRALRWLERLIAAAALGGGAWLALRFVLPGLAPFLLAYVLAALMEPAVRLLRRLHGAAPGKMGQCPGKGDQTQIPGDEPEGF